MSTPPINPNIVELLEMAFAGEGRAYVLVVLEQSETKPGTTDAVAVSNLTPEGAMRVLHDMAASNVEVRLRSGITQH